MGEPEGVAIGEKGRAGEKGKYGSGRKGGGDGVWWEYERTE